MQARMHLSLHNQFVSPTPRHMRCCRASSQQEPCQQAPWLPPHAWVSTVLAGLNQSVDVDSVEAYTDLLQQCLVLQPSLLHTDPQRAERTCQCLEHFTQTSCVLYGPETMSDVLQQHSPVSLRSHLSGLMQALQSEGLAVHTFQRLCRAAPEALLLKDAQQLRQHLEQLQLLVPEVHICSVLIQNSRLARFLLKQKGVGHLASCFHRPLSGVLVVTHPCIHGVKITHRNVGSISVASEARRATHAEGAGMHVVVSVYGHLATRFEHLDTQRLAERSSNRTSAHTTTSDGSSSTLLAPWEQPVDGSCNAASAGADVSSNGRLFQNSDIIEGVSGSRTAQPLLDDPPGASVPISLLAEFDVQLPGGVDASGASPVVAAVGFDA